MRVNHTGEVMAQALYQGQALTAHLTDVRNDMEKAAQEEAEAPEGWVKTLSLGVNKTSGNSETLSANGSFVAENDADVHAFRLGVEANFGESESEVVLEDGTVLTVDETTTENAKGFANYKRKFDEFFGYSDNVLLSDDIALVDYRL